ncbi:SRPBCC family protein [Ramlibacter sp. MMS24-I3-19]|uniref:SRPBCC family protein n=1 Tax=Ramlibacter sp. MMS24-I3-19 TaxID=3416606 RepID=UPI003CFBC6FC
MENPNRTTYAALAAGGLLLADQVRRYRRRTMLDDLNDNVSDVMNSDVRTRMPMGTAVLGLAALVGGALYLSNVLRSSPGSGRASNVHEAIELEVPVSTAYNQWTQFEQFPKFMATVQEVRQVDDTHLHWRAVVGGKTKEWDAEITEQIPDKRIAWRSTNGVANGGVVTFHKIGENRTRVMLQMDYEPETLGEKVGDAIGGVKLTAKGNLKRFKQLVEQRGAETGAWRGTVTEH